MGGSATNAGTDYQQRVAALALLATYVELDLSQVLQANVKLVPQTISFETADSVDDLRIDCESNESLYLQIKRTISLSRDKSSEFAKTIAQFVRQFTKQAPGGKAKSKFILVTTPKASNKITENLRKILNSARLNPASLSLDPLNKHEKETLQTFRKTVEREFLSETKHTMSEGEFIEFCQKTFVSTIDAEPSRSAESAILMVLQSEGFCFPGLVWHHLIANCFSYAGNRQSVSKEYLEQSLKRFKVDSNDKKQLESVLAELLRPTIVDMQRMPSGKDVVLANGPEPDVLLLMELLRFDAIDKPRSRFSGDTVTVKSGAEYKILRRFASANMATEYLCQNRQLVGDRKLMVIPSKSADEIEKTPAAEHHRQRMIAALEANKSLVKCLHCGASSIFGGAFLVELDAKEYPFTVGIVCAEHVRPSDRILGMPQMDANTSNYNPSIEAPAWLAAIQRGQGFMGASSLLKRPDQHTFLLWNEENAAYYDYKCCVKFTLADDSVTYSYVRGRIHRMAKPEAERQVEVFRKVMSDNASRGDPLCFSSKTWTVGPRSQVDEMKDANETSIEVKSVEVAEYSAILGTVYNRCDSYYAPLCVVRDKESETPLLFGNAVPLISNPFTFSEVCENWKFFIPDFSVESVRLSPLLTDHDFDNFMREVTSDGFVAVVDPTFDAAGDPLAGIVVRAMPTNEEMLKFKAMVNAQYNHGTDSNGKPGQATTT